MGNVIDSRKNDAQPQRPRAAVEGAPVSFNCQLLKRSAKCVSQQIIPGVGGKVPNISAFNRMQGPVLAAKKWQYFVDFNNSHDNNGKPVAQS